MFNKVQYPYGIVIVGQHMYWTDWKTKGLHRADKNNPSDPITIRRNLDGLMDIRAVEVILYNRRHDIRNNFNYK